MSFSAIPQLAGYGGRLPEHFVTGPLQIGNMGCRVRDNYAERCCLHTLQKINMMLRYVCRTSAEGPYSVHAVKVEDIVGLVLLVCLLDLRQDFRVVADSAGGRHQAWGVNEAHTDAIDGAIQQLHLGSQSKPSHG